MIKYRCINNVNKIFIFIHNITNNNNNPFVYDTCNNLVDKSNIIRAAVIKILKVIFTFYKSRRHFRNLTPGPLKMFKFVLIIIKFDQCHG